MKLPSQKPKQKEYPKDIIDFDADDYKVATLMAYVWACCKDVRKENFGDDYAEARFAGALELAHRVSNRFQTFERRKQERKIKEFKKD